MIVITELALDFPCFKTEGPTITLPQLDVILSEKRSGIIYWIVHRITGTLEMSLEILQNFSVNNTILKKLIMKKYTK